MQERSSEWEKKESKKNKRKYNYVCLVKKRNWKNDIWVVGERKKKKERYKIKVRRVECERKGNK